MFLKPPRCHSENILPYSPLIQALQALPGIEGFYCNSQSVDKYRSLHTNSPISLLAIDPYYLGVSKKLKLLTENLHYENVE